MLLTRANNLHVKKEVCEEKVLRHNKEGGNKNIVNVGDQIKCPECNRIGRVVWVSKDGETAGIQCSASHRLTSRPASKFGTVARPRSKNSRNMVFLTKIK